MPTKAYQLLIFDWDGTLVDSSAYLVKGIQQLALELNLNPPAREAIMSVLGLELLQAYEYLFPQQGLLFMEFAQRYRQLSWQNVRQQEILFRGVRELLLALHEQDYLLAVATGKSRAGLDLALRQLELNSLFAATRCADETYAKPHPQMIYELLEELMVEPQQVLLIGDSECDMQLAKNAKVDALAVLNHARSAEELLAYCPRACLAVTPDLLPWLNQAQIVC